MRLRLDAEHITRSAALIARAQQLAEGGARSTRRVADVVPMDIDGEEGEAHRAARRGQMSDAEAVAQAEEVEARARRTLSSEAVVARTRAGAKLLERYAAMPAATRLPQGMGVEATALEAEAERIAAANEQELLKRRRWNVERMPAVEHQRRDWEETKLAADAAADEAAAERAQAAAEADAAKEAAAEAEALQGAEEARQGESLMDISDAEDLMSEDELQGGAAMENLRALRIDPVRAQRVAAAAGGDAARAVDMVLEEYEAEADAGAGSGAGETPGRVGECGVVSPGADAGARRWACVGRRQRWAAAARMRAPSRPWSA